MSNPMLSCPPVVPVTVIDDADQAVPLAQALVEGGLPVIEVTFRTEAAAEAIQKIRYEVPGVQVGAGTVLSAEQAKMAVDAGAQFAVAPGGNPDVVAAFLEMGVPFLPGVASPTDIERAYALGCKQLKFFPAGTLGGAAALKSMGAPYTHLGIQYNPTGGVTLANLADYFAVPGVVAVGGTWVAPRGDIQSGQWEAITARAAEALAVATSATDR